MNIMSLSEKTFDSPIMPLPSMPPCTQNYENDYMTGLPQDASILLRSPRLGNDKLSSIKPISKGLSHHKRMNQRKAGDSSGHKHNSRKIHRHRARSCTVTSSSRNDFMTASLQEVLKVHQFLCNSSISSLEVSLSEGELDDDSPELDEPAPSTTKTALADSICNPSKSLSAYIKEEDYDYDTDDDDSYPSSDDDDDYSIGSIDAERWVARLPKELVGLPPSERDSRWFGSPITGPKRASVPFSSQRWSCDSATDGTGVSCNSGDDKSPIPARRASYGDTLPMIPNRRDYFEDR